MEKMPYQPELERAANIVTSTLTTADWREGLPVLAGSNFTLRQLRVEDAPTLFAMLTPDEVSRFISPPPRGNGALRKIGAVQEGVLRRSFLRHGQYQDQVLWSILAEDWRLQRGGDPVAIH